MNIREDVIYARQSVDRKDSISIESQIDFCKYELKGGSCRVFKDKGYSKAPWRDTQRQGTPGSRLQAGQNKPLHFGLCEYDGAVSGIRCRVCFFHRKV